MADHRLGAALVMQVTFKSRSQVTVDHLSVMSHPIHNGGTAADKIPRAVFPAGRQDQKVPRAGDEASASRMGRSAKVALPHSFATLSEFSASRVIYHPTIELRTVL